MVASQKQREGHLAQTAVGGGLVSLPLDTAALLASLAPRHHRLSCLHLLLKICDPTFL